MSNQDIDILSQIDNIDLSTVETARPHLASGVYEFTVQKMELVDQKAPKTGKNLNIQLGLVEPAQSVPNEKGETKLLNAGFPVFDLISLTKTFKENGDVNYDPLPRLAKFREAVLGSKDGKFMPIEQYIGQRVMVKVNYSATNVDKKTGQDYGPKTSVSDYVKRK